MIRDTYHIGIWSMENAKSPWDMGQRMFGTLRGQLVGCTCLYPGCADSDTYREIIAPARPHEARKAERQPLCQSVELSLTTYQILSFDGFSVMRPSKIKVSLR